jgi:hypothetical protein
MADAMAAPCPASVVSDPDRRAELRRAFMVGLSAQKMAAELVEQQLANFLASVGA